MWGGQPELWAVLQNSLESWLEPLVWGLLPFILVISPLTGLVGGILTALGYKRLVSWWVGLVIFVAVSVAIGVAFVVADGVAFVVAGGVAGIIAVGVAIGVAGVVGIVTDKENSVNETDIGIYGVVGVIAGAVLSIVAGLVGCMFIVPFVLTFTLAVSVASSLVGLAGGMLSVVEGVVAGGVAFVVANGVAGGVAGLGTLPLTLSLFLVMGTGFALSQRRAFSFGLVWAVIIAALFIEPQGWLMAALVLLAFLVSYFRLPLYPLALLGLNFARLFRSPGYNLPSENSRILIRPTFFIPRPRINRLLRRLPPLADEIVWLRLYGLDRLLADAVKESPKQGREAVEVVANSFRQAWAAPSAWLQLSARALTGYHTVEQIPDSSSQFEWLPDEPDEKLRSVSEIRYRLKEIGREVETALNAANDYNRLRGFNRARDKVGNLGKFFAALRPPDPARHFRPIPAQWELLINREITRLTTEQEVKADIPNPYITGIPIRPDEQAMFAPRPDLKREVENLLTAGHGKPTLALYGPRRMGKSTFLLHLPRLLPDEIVPVMVDLQAAVQSPTPGGLYYQWASAAYKTAQRERGLLLPKPEWDDFDKKQAIAWGEWLDEAEPVLGRRKLFFTFDEFERLVDSAEQNPALVGTFDILRNVSQHRPGVYLLFAGAHRMEEMAPGGRWHDYFISVHGLEVSYLSKAETRRLLTRPIPDFPLDYAPGAVDEIIRLTRCQPYLTQLCGSILVNRLNSPARRKQGDYLTATPADIEHSARELLQQGRPYFANLWKDSAGEAGRQVLAAAAQTPDGVSKEKLALQLRSPADELPPILHRLEQYRLLEPVKGRWRVQVELTRRAFARFDKSEI